MQRIFILLSFLFLVSCTGNTIYKKPENLIPKEKMVSLWTDILIANAAKNVKNKDLRNKVNYLPFLLEKYDIDSARFMQSNIYYTSKAEDYKKMFKKVEENLIELRDKHDPESAGIDRKLPIWERDSIKRSRRLDSVNKKSPKKFKGLKDF